MVKRETQKFGQSSRKRHVVGPWPNNELPAWFADHKSNVRWRPGLSSIISSPLSRSLVQWQGKMRIQGKGSKSRNEIKVREDPSGVWATVLGGDVGGGNSPSSIYARSGRSYATVHQDTKATRIGPVIDRKTRSRYITITWRAEYTVDSPDLGLELSLWTCSRRYSVWSVKRQVSCNLKNSRPVSLGFSTEELSFWSGRRFSRACFWIFFHSQRHGRHEAQYARGKWSACHAAGIVCPGPDHDARNELRQATPFTQVRDFLREFHEFK